MIREEELFLHEGHAEQHKLHAALPQHMASWPAPQTPKTAPMFDFHDYY